MDKIRYGTWDEWKALGFHVKKGQKSEKRFNNIPVFSEYQVEKNQSSNRYIGCDDEDYMEEDVQFMYDMGFGDR